MAEQATSEGYHVISQHQEAPEGENTPFTSWWFSDLDYKDSWLFEILALLCSAGLLVAACILLRTFDEEPQPIWNMISLNTIISWISTLSKALILLPISQCLGQLKWTWFAGKPRALSDVNDFDAASRGVAGSLQLLLAKSRWLVLTRHQGVLAILS